MGVRSGTLRHRILIQVQTGGKDPDGYEIPEWADVATVWGRIDPSTGREFLEGRASVGETLVTITIRYGATIAGITPDRYRIVRGSTIYDIISVANVGERNHYFEITARYGSAVRTGAT